MTRAEHLAWCKQRAREYVSAGDLAGAVASMNSDLTKHPDTRAAAELSMIGMMEAMHGNVNGVTRWIEGFN